MAIKKAEDLSPYAPLRHRSQLWWRFAVNAAKEGNITPEGLISSDLMGTVENGLVAEYFRQFVESNKNTPEFESIVGRYSAKLLSFRHWVPFAGQYELCGRQIFDLDDSLVEMLVQTDLGECTLGDWHPPHHAFYVYFGKQEDAKLPFDEDTYEYLDGAFVAVTPYDETGSRIKFGFTTVKEDGTGVRLPGYFFDLRPEEQQLPIEEAVDHSLNRRIEEFDRMMAVEGNSEGFYHYRKEEVSEGATLMKAGAKLLINALFYLESIGKKQLPDPEPGRDSPSAKVVAWKQSSGTKRRKQESSLTADGYAIVRFVGREMSGISHGPNQSGGKRSHWRRGHWRQQRCGPKNAEVKRTWIKPMVIGREGSLPIDNHGRVYVADNRNNTH